MDTNRCQGWVNPNNISFSPYINSLTSYQSPAGSNTVVSIDGLNFCSYSRISFGTLSPTVYFINTNILQFYVPNTLSTGYYPVQVFNGSIASNSVNYFIDNASGYWILNSDGSITNTNTGNTSIVQVKSLSRSTPVYIDSTYNINNPYIVPYNINWISCNTSNSDIYIQLPYSSLNTGREIMIKNISTNKVYSNSTNIIPFNNINMTNCIIGLPPNFTSWVTLVSTGTAWIIMQGV